MRCRRLALALVMLLVACGGERATHPGNGGNGGNGHDVAVGVRLVTLDPVSNSPVIVLQETAGARKLPIWIGLSEARSIAQRLEEVEPPRPNTHDLAQRLVEGLDARIERVTVTDLRDGTYYAVIALRDGGRRIEIDSRPSDAIAIALRVAAPVFVREGLFDDAVEETDEHRRSI